MRKGRGTNVSTPAGLLALLAAGLLLLAAPGFAQETVGGLQGTVTSEEGGSALPGVQVTIRNNNTGVEQVKRTSSNGGYRFVAVPVGAYTVIAELDQFQSVQNESVRIQLGSTTTIDLAMKVGVIEDVIVVTSEAPLVDTTSTVSGITVNTGQFGDRVPIQREVTQIALLAPGTTQGDSAFNSSASTYTPGQSLTSIGGSSVAENTYLVNGLNITNFRNGVGGSNVPFEFVEEVQIKTGGYAAEFGRSTGGVVNMVTRTGTNNFRGGLNVFHQPESLQEQSPDYYAGINSAEFNENTEANFTFGGPIARDKAFFFGFYQVNDDSNSGVGITRETVRSYDDPFYGAKIDFNLTASHRIEGTYFTDSVDVTAQEFEFDAATRTRGAFVGDSLKQVGGDNLIAKYTGIFGSNFVLSAQYGENKFDRINQSSGDAFPAVWDSRSSPTQLIGPWVNIQVGVADDTREASRLDLDYFLGDHSLRAGFDNETNTSNDLTIYSGGTYYRYFVGDTSRFPTIAPGTEVVRVRVFEGGGQFETQSNAYYLQDSWEVSDQLLLNLGIRVESFDNQNSLGESFIKEDGQYAPRLGAVYDISGDGRSKLYTNYGRYHLYIASNTNIRLAGAETFTEDWHLFTGMDPTTFAPVALGELLEANVFGNGTVPDVRTTKSEQVDPMYQDEFVVGYERQVADNWSVGVRGVYRTFGEIIEDLTIDAALGIPGAFEYRLANPGTDFTGFFDPDHDGQNLIPVAFGAAELGYPDPERDYYAAEFTFNKHFSDNWMFQGSYTWSHSYGNYEGYVRSDNGQDDAGLTTLYDFSGLLDNGSGNLPNDRRHNLKLFGAYQFDNGLMLGANTSWRSGRPLNAFGIHPTDPFSQLYGAESFFNQGVAVNRGTVGNTDDVTVLDLNAKYDIDMGRATVTLKADVFNLFDSDTATELNETADEESGIADVNYLSATRFQRPRGVRFGVGIRF